MSDQQFPIVKRKLIMPDGVNEYTLSAIEFLPYYRKSTQTDKYAVSTDSDLSAPLCAVVDFFTFVGSNGDEWTTGEKLPDGSVKYYRIQSK